MNLNTPSTTLPHFLKVIYNLPTHPDTKGKPAAFAVESNSYMPEPAQSIFASAAEGLLAGVPTENSIRWAELLLTFMGQSASGTAPSRWSHLNARLIKMKYEHALVDVPVTDAVSNADIRELLLLATEAVKPTHEAAALLTRGLELLPKWDNDRRLVSDCIATLAAEIPVPAPAEPEAYMVEIKSGGVWRQAMLVYNTAPDYDAKEHIWKEYQQKRKEYPNNTYRVTAIYK